MQTLDNAELAFLAVLGWPRLARRVLKMYADGTVLFNSYLYPHIDLMMRTMMAGMKKARENGVRLSSDQLAADLAEAIASSTVLTPDLTEKSDQLLQRFVSGDMLSEQEGLYQITKLVKRDAARKLGSLITANTDFEQLKQSLDVSSRVVDDLQTEAQGEKSRKFVFNPFEEIRELTKFLPRIPTGINWFDQASHGGAREGECWLLLGPSSGGKSMITVMLSCAQALMGNQTVWVTYEQTLYGDLAERMIANITDTSLDDIRDKSFAGLPQDVQDKFEAAVSGAKDKLMCMDMTQFVPDPSDPLDTGGMYSVCRQIKEKLDAGARIKFVLVDWIGAMASRVFARTGGQMKRDFQSFAQSEVMYAHDFAEAHGLFFLFFHQTDTEAQHARPTYCPDMTNARDDHGLCFYFDATFTLGVRDKHGICWFNPAKTRKANTQPMTLKMVGDRARFDYAPGWVANRDGQFYNPAEQDDGFQDDSGSPVQPASASYRREVD